jgi:glyoxylase-like metal-dependent hydrolase (beta-lactamase superfamily II)
MPHRYSWQLLRAGTFHLDGGSMFGIVPKAIWSTDDADGTRVLIETGYGDKWSGKERGFYALEHRTVTDALREADVDPAAGDIDHVVVTHLHFDHAAGLTTLDADGQPVSQFPGAKIHIQKREWEDALANRSTMTRTYLQSHLEPIADQVVLHDGEDEIFSGAGIRVFPVPGHTWGQQAVQFDDEHGTIVFPGDVMPTTNHVGPTFSMAYDVEPYTNMLSKRSLLERAAGEGWRIAIDHEPGDPVVTVAPDATRPGRFTLHPA